ncbi:MAG: hypothetical protein AB8E82_12505 [Aureispira sp.]
MLQLLQDSFSDSPARKNPVKCNGVSHHETIYKHNHVMVVDWLTVHYHISDLSLLSGFVGGKLNIGNICLLLQDFQTRHFKSICRVSVGGVDLGILSFTPSSAVSYSENSCSLKITNSRFYDNTWFGMVQELEKSLGFVFRNITRLDIALDTTCTNLLNLVDRYAHSSDGGITEDVKYLGRSKFDMFGSNIDGLMTKNFKIGVPRSKDSKILRTFTIYNKTRELETSKKEYITNFHHNNGLVFCDVFRHELRLQSSFIRKINRSHVCLDTGELLGSQRITLSDINSPVFLNSLYKYSLNRFVDFTTHTGVKNITARPRLELFSFDFLPCDSIYFERVKPANSSSSQTAKCTVRFLLNELFTSPVNDNGDLEISSVTGAIIDIVSRYNLSSWFNKKFVRWTFEIDCHVDFYRCYKGHCYNVFKAFYNKFAKDKPNVYAI